MSELTQTLHDLPWSGLIPLGLLMVVGFMLWIAGRRILRAGFAVIGFIVGALVGLVISEASGMVGVSMWVTAGIGAVVLAIASVLAYRVVVAGAMALLLAIAAPLAVVMVVEVQAHRAGVAVKDGEIHNQFSDELTDWLRQHDDPAARQQAGDAIKSAADSAKQQIDQSIDRAKDALSDAFGEKPNEHIEDFQRFTRRLLESARQQWDQTPEKLRPTLILASVVGSIVGLMLGLLAHSFSASAVTALGGSLLWLTGLRILAIRLGAPEGLWMPSSGMAWLGVWLITASVGLGIQWTLRRRRADKSAS